MRWSLGFGAWELISFLKMPSVIAIGAHPDDIEFVMAGTLLLLGEAGWDLHYLNLSSGNLGSTTMTPAQTARVRRAEAQAAAKVLGATWHPPFCNDVEIFYDGRALRRLGAIIREVAPDVVLTHAPQDYMEDHMITSRLAVSAAFVRAMPGYRTTPARTPVPSDVTIYHASPHGLRDGLRRRVHAGAFVNTTSVHAKKTAALECHASQRGFLDTTQGMSSYVKTMNDLSREVGKQSGRFRRAEGWRRHLHWGFSSEGRDPLRDALGRNYLINTKYEQGLDNGS